MGAGGVIQTVSSLGVGRKKKVLRTYGCRTQDNVPRREELGGDRLRVTALKSFIYSRARLKLLRETACVLGNFQDMLVRLSHHMSCQLSRLSWSERSLSKR